MKYLTSILAIAGLAAAAPTSSQLEERDVQTVHLIFHGGPASYNLTLPADGKVYPTNNNIAVSIIDAPDYNAFQQCTFYTPGPHTLASSISPEGVGQVIVGPPQPVTGVSCYGMCVQTYGDCYSQGQYVGPCCNGFCAANKCRPWVQPT
ncbi:hypothetical protein QBC46DRAFT_295732 [Diplogelasinospora grovesii]|uniref:Uncharacterized protein n=1 Tax=Diplogelasinospora grovesii TaxID=303347 RepID=A0AAN6N020_9PEZI|nr:hypothetical protein QBC46DRAFT_295732 [Diplogelasinospora grovesii]